MDSIFKIEPGEKQKVLQDINLRGKNTMAEYLGIEFTEIGNDYLVAKMPVCHKNVQPLRYLNGGASLALAETAGSLAANLCVDRDKYVCLGLDINGNHLKPIKEGHIAKAIAKPYHIGKTTQVWDIKIYDDNDNLGCVARLTIAVVLKNKHTKK